jgi:hypothetical protein
VGEPPDRACLRPELLHRRALGEVHVEDGDRDPAVRVRAAAPGTRQSERPRRSRASCRNPGSCGGSGVTPERVAPLGAARRRPAGPFPITPPAPAANRGCVNARGGRANRRAFTSARRRGRMRSTGSSNGESSSHVQRTTFRPRSRRASSRSFSRYTASPGSWPGRRPRPYFILPSNSPTVRNSSQYEVRAGAQLGDVVLQHRGAEAEPARSLRGCASPPGSPPRGIGCGDDPSCRRAALPTGGPATPPRRPPESRGARTRQRPPRPAPARRAASGPGRPACAAPRSLRRRPPRRPRRHPGPAVCTCSTVVRRPPERRFRVTWTRVQATFHNTRPWQCGGGRQWLTTGMW